MSSSPRDLVLLTDRPESISRRLPFAAVNGFEATTNTFHGVLVFDRLAKDADLFFQSGEASLDLSERHSGSPSCCGAQIVHQAETTFANSDRMSLTAAWTADFQFLSAYLASRWA